MYEIDGVENLSTRHNIWGTFRILRNRHGTYFVSVVRDIGEPKEALWVMCTMKQAKTRQNFEASRYKQYRYY